MAFYKTDMHLFYLGNKELPNKREEDIPYIQITDLTILTDGQRIALATTVVSLCILSVFGNFGTLYANQRRKLRVFFRTCLISLAVSDLITTLFMVMGYLAQFRATSVQIWLIGGLMCRFIPFVTTGVILVSSFTLVGIALDRYFAVMRAVFWFWNPNKTFSILFAFLIWGLSFGIASPMYSAYMLFEVNVITPEANDPNHDMMDITGLETVYMCISEKESNAYYYVVVLAIIFVPTLVFFVWLNSIIANKLWIRRHSISATPSPPTTTILSSTPACSRPDEKQTEFIQKYPPPCDFGQDNKICTSPQLKVPTSLGVKPNSPVDGSSGDGEGNSAKHISSREARHLRMFTIVLILMAVFIFFRLPAWIFLIMRMYGTYTRPVHWILHFSFGILTLTSCVLNPLLYTFLAETIQYAMFLRGKLCDLRRYFGNCGLSELCLWCSKCNDDKDNDKMSHNPNQSDEVTDKWNREDGNSNDGAKSVSRKSDDDSVVYTITPNLTTVV